jgi:hypothetical protein
MVAQLETRDYILRIEPDTDTEDPLRYSDYRVVSFFRNRRLITDGDIEEFYDDTPDGYRPKLGIRSKLKAGTAFRLDYYEHGGSSWSLSGEGMQDGWDTSRGAGILLYTGKPNDMGKTYAERRENARLTLEAYNEWANGSCFWYSLENADTGEQVDSCGGCIGYEYTAEAIVDYANLADLGPCRIKTKGTARDIAEMYAAKFPPNVTFVTRFDDDGEGEIDESDEY